MYIVHDKVVTATHCYCYTDNEMDAVNWYLHSFVRRFNIWMVQMEIEVPIEDERFFA